MVPPERVELSSLAPEASTLSTELQGHVFDLRITLWGREQQAIRWTTPGPGNRLGAFVPRGLKNACFYTRVPTQSHLRDLPS